jgi:hypothetical protein
MIIFPFRIFFSKPEFSGNVSKIDSHFFVAKYSLDMSETGRSWSRSQREKILGPSSVQKKIGDGPSQKHFGPGTRDGTGPDF